jgi:hypothetical protein
MHHPGPLYMYTLLRQNTCSPDTQRYFTRSTTLKARFAWAKTQARRRQPLTTAQQRQRTGTEKLRPLLTCQRASLEWRQVRAPALAGQKI